MYITTYCVSVIIIEDGKVVNTGVVWREYKFNLLDRAIPRHVIEQLMAKMFEQKYTFDRQMVIVSEAVLLGY